MDELKTYTLKELHDQVQDLLRRADNLEKPFSWARGFRLVVVFLPMWAVPFGILWGLGVPPEWAARFALALFLMALSGLFVLVLVMKGHFKQEIELTEARINLLREQNPIP